MGIFYFYPFLFRFCGMLLYFIIYFLCFLANSFLKEKELFDRSMQYETNFEAVARYGREIGRLK